MGNESPKITVIIPVYNVEKYIEECIQSVRSQTLQELQIICINDGSTDDSGEIINRISKKDGRITLINQNNAGLSAARNVGINNAKGEYIYFLDADDYIDPTALEKLYKKAKNEELDIVLFNASPFYESKSLERYYIGYKNYYKRKNDYPVTMSGPQLLSEMLQNRDYKVSCCIQMFRRNFLLEHKIGFREGILYEDNIFTLSAMLTAKRVGYINEILFYRRFRSDSILTKPMTSKNVISFYECMKGIKTITDDILDNSVLENQLIKLAAGFKNKVMIIQEQLEEEERKKVKQYIENDQDFGISMIIVINKLESFDYILENYNRQRFKHKELIIVSNNRTNGERLRNLIKSNQTIQIYQVHESGTLGECINYGVTKAKYLYVVKMVEEYYYKEKYLSEIMEVFRWNKCDVVVKSRANIGVEEKRYCYTCLSSNENTYIHTVVGGTICCKRRVVEETPFVKQSGDIDRIFLLQAAKRGYRIYSTSAIN